MNKVFDELANIFSKNGFSLFMIGSTSRDYLLNKEIFDYDFVSDATPFDIKKFLNNNELDTTFERFGTLKYKYLDKKIDIVTLRKEEDYLDSRHPNKIIFIKDINEDYLRRDFTINAIYIDKNYNIIDPANGYKDLKDRKLRFIKDPLISIKEDPLRILRAYRFIKEYNLSIDDNVLKILKENEILLKNIRKEKISEEKRKYEEVLKRCTTN